MLEILKILAILIAINSTKVDDIKHFDDISALLKRNEFSVEIFEERGVYNLYSEFIGNKSTTDISLAFVGHLDVVPSGDSNLWSSNPFILTERQGEIYGRGAVDMKSSIATFIQASFDYIKQGGKSNIAIVLTGDEETNSFGALGLKKFLQNKNKKINQILIGEPTSEKNIGDTIKNGRRGSANFILTISGVQGHVAYPQLAKNPFDCLSVLLPKLTNLRLDEGTSDFQPSKLVITSIDTGNATKNIIPQTIKIQFNIRYNILHGLENLRKILTSLLNDSCMNYNYELNLISNSNSFLSPKNQFTKIIIDSIQKITGFEPICNTNGGTSDGRILYEIAPIIEFGPLNNTAHKVNEKITLDDLKVLYDVYLEVLKRL